VTKHPTPPSYSWKPSTALLINTLGSRAAYVRLGYYYWTSSLLFGWFLALGMVLDKPIRGRGDEYNASLVTSIMLKQERLFGANKTNKAAEVRSCKCQLNATER
jgi:hypothetical protein